ncbi:hypothetical protein [uncultured Duncaniella sp.]|uniref:hypothetical protein n=1 Tax=uncultured Duncaniella sp. TaxID=2768039 RepID=UPI0025B1BFE9|nr:hypothetical protein [uncultured Duncaniella sp.]
MDKNLEDLIFEDLDQQYPARRNDEDFEDSEEESADLDFMLELKQAAWNIVRENPGIDRPEWIDELIRQYPTEVVDAYGTNPPEVFQELSDLWDMEYTNPETEEWHSFAYWSEYFANDLDVLHDKLDRANESIRELETEVALLKARLQSKVKPSTTSAP